MTKWRELFYNILMLHWWKFFFCTSSQTCGQSYKRNPVTSITSNDIKEWNWRNLKLVVYRIVSWNNFYITSLFKTRIIRIVLKSVSVVYKVPKFQLQVFQIINFCHNICSSSDHINFLNIFPPYCQFHEHFIDALSTIFIDKKIQI